MLRLEKSHDFIKVSTGESFQGHFLVGIDDSGNNFITDDGELVYINYKYVVFIKSLNSDLKEDAK